MKKRTLLTGHTSRETAYSVNVKEKGRIRKAKFCWIETMLAIGDRLATVRIDPVTRKPGKVQYGPETSFICLFKDRNGRVKQKRYAFTYNAITNKKAFPRLLKLVNPTAISELQQLNIRIDMMRSFKRHANVEFAYRKGASRSRYADWMNMTLLHLRDCPFEQLADYPAPPPYRKQVW